MDTLFRRAWTRAVIAAIAALLVYGETASAETVIARRRLGNNVEAMTYDPVNDRAVVMDGNDVVGIALNLFDSAALATMRNDFGGISGSGYRKLFDVLALPIEARQPKGIGYVASQHRYFFTTDTPGATGALYSTDEEGNPRPPLVLRGLAAPVDFWEGIAWIPPGSPVHPGTLAVLGYRNDDGFSHVFYIRLDGTVEQEQVPQPDSPLQTYFCGISVRPDHASTLFLTDCTTGVFSMDMRTGSPVGPQPVIALGGTGGYEGLLFSRDGSLYVSTYWDGRLLAYDRSFHRAISKDRLFQAGLGVSARWLAWNSDTQQLLTLGVDNRVYSVSRDLQQAVFLFDTNDTNEVPNPWGISYLGNNQVALSCGGPPFGIDVVQLQTLDATLRPNGTSLSRLIWSGPLMPGALYAPRGLSLLDPADPTTFVFHANNVPGVLRVVTTTGGTPRTDVYRDGIAPVLLPDIILSQPTQGRDVQVFDDGSGKRIFTGAEIYGMDGTLIHRIDWQKLGLMAPASNGAWIGGNTFATVDGLTSTVVIYSVP